MEKKKKKNLVIFSKSYLLIYNKSLFWTKKN